MDLDTFLLKSQPEAVEFPPNSGIFTAYILLSDFINIIKIPTIQRELDVEWKDTLKSKILSEKLDKGYYDFGQFIFCYFNDNYHLLNGQHRYQIASELSDKDIRLKIEIRQVTSEIEMRQLWQSGNNSKSVSIVKNIDDQLIINRLRKYMTSHFRNYLSNRQNPHLPNLNLDIMIKTIETKRVIQKLKITDPEEFINKIKQLNNFYNTNQYQLDIWEKWFNSRKINEKVKKCRDKSPSNPLYLGLWKHYEWLDRLVDASLNGKDYSIISHYPISIKPRKISRKLRLQVWRKRNNSIVGKCYVCGDKNTTFENFQCGHIIAYYYGGESTLNNLEPICSSCNNDMGTENLDRYKQREYG
jgi:hypothetical protein